MLHPLRRWPRFAASRGLSLVLVCGLAAPSPAQTAAKSAPRAQDAGEARAPVKGRVFEVQYPGKLGDQPITARVYVMFGPAGAQREPRFGPDWFRPQPFFARDVKGWKPGAPVAIDEEADGYPDRLDRLAPGDYVAQAVVRLNPDTHRIGDGEGNAYGPAVPVKLGDEPVTIKLSVDTLVPPRKFAETDRIKLAELESPMLSAFYHRPIKHRAAVILPSSQAGRKVPALYIIPGFGGDHHMASRFVGQPRTDYASDFVRIVLDPDCGTGHHVFADSATNGPRGKALTEEFIPYLEKTFPIIAEPGARLLNGHSSGGWSSLWLQVTYPDFFGGTWSTSPDPVDFRDFQQVNIYQGNQNIYHDQEGKRRPIARMGGTPVIFYDRFSRLEQVMGDGGQLGSFEAVFSRLGPDGRFRRLWNREDGAIDPEVAKSWEAYDIRLVLERNWAERGPKLAGKIHVITGGMDTFYLEGAVKLLKESLAKRDSDAVIEIIPGRDHGSVLDAELARRLDREMHDAVASYLGRNAGQGQ
jgi:hypothetical protein